MVLDRLVRKIVSEKRKCTFLFMNILLVSLKVTLEWGNPVSPF